MMAGPAAPRAPAQQRSSRGAAAKPSSSSSSASCRGAAQPPRGLGPSSRHRRHACVAPQAFMAPPDASSLEATTSLISGVVTTGCLAAAVYLLSAPQGQQEAQVEEREACPRCEGSGFEPCICRRWSDDDLGCASCAGKLGYMRCTACGGGGRAKALLAYRPVRMDNKGPPPGGRGM